MLSLPCLDCGGIQLRYAVIEKTNDKWSVDCGVPGSSLCSLSRQACPVFVAADIWRFIEGYAGGAVTRYLNKMQSCKLLTKIKFIDISVEGIKNSNMVNFVSIQAIFMALFSSHQPNCQLPVVSCLYKIWRKFIDCELPPVLEYQSSGQSAREVSGQSAREVSGDVSSSPIEDILERLDELQYEKTSHITALRSLLNSYRSVHTSYGDRGLTKLITHSELTAQHLLTCLESNKEQLDVDKLILESSACQIGKSFAEQNSVVQQKINNFKKENIQTIDKLPSAKVTCYSLFSTSMIKLFESWLTVTHAQHTTNEQGDTAPKCKQARLDVDIYPFIQLILEFANNSLISGEAHVIFPRLLCRRDGYT